MKMQYDKFYQNGDRVNVGTYEIFSGLSELSTSISHMKFRSIEQYNEAKQLQTDILKLQNDTTIVYQGVRFGDYSNKISASRATYISDTTRSINLHAQKLSESIYASYDDKIIDKDTKTQLIYGLAGVNRGATNITGRNFKIPAKGNIDTTNKLRRDVYKATEKTDNMIDPTVSLYSDRPVEPWISRETRDFGEKAEKMLPVIQKLRNMAWTQILKFYPAYTQAINNGPQLYDSWIVPVFWEALSKAIGPVLFIFNKMSGSMTEVIRQMNTAQASMEQWGDIQKNPIGAISQLMGGVNAIVIQSFKGAGSIINTIVGIVGGIFKKIFGQKDKKEDGKSATLSIVTGVISSLAGIVSNIFNLSQSMISGTIRGFQSITIQILKILKAVQNTSPVLKTILNYISLAISLFFLPFFTYFGDKVIDYILQFITTLLEFVRDNYSQIMDLFGHKEDIQQAFDKCFELIKEFCDKHIDEVMEAFKGLIPPLLKFIEAFVETIISNQQAILDMVKQGISAYAQLLNQNIIGTLLSLGIDCMDFLNENFNTLIELFNWCQVPLQIALSVFEILMGNFELCFYLSLMQFGAIQGAVAQWNAWMIASALSLGILALTFPIFIQFGQGIGQGVGLVMQAFLSENFVKPMFQTDHGDWHDAPKFAQGGRVKYTPGGLVGLVAEAHEGEYIVPESKLKLFRGDNNIIIRVKGKTYRTDQLNDAIEELRRESPHSFTIS